MKLLCSEVCALRTSEVSPNGEVKEAPSVTASRATFLLGEGKGFFDCAQDDRWGLLNSEVFAYGKSEVAVQ